MVATVANSALISVATLPSNSDAKSSTQNTNRGIRLKANVQAPSKLNGATIKTDDHDVTPLLSSSSSSKGLLDWSMFFGNNTTQFTRETNESDDDDADNHMLIDSFGSGKFVHNGLVFRQNFPIRSYEIGADGTVSLETLMNHLQETVLNHLKAMGLLGDGLGSTPEMCKRKLIWVTSKIQIVVDRYPTWGDKVQVDDWIVPSGKSSMRRDSLIRDCKTGEVLVRASSNWVMMNRETRKLCRIPDEVREEMSPYLMNAAPIVEKDNKTLPKLDETISNFIRGGLKPRWSDLDINQHVNNAKYISWILESAPPYILGNQEISSITMDYRRECHRNNVLQSLTTLSDDPIGGSVDSDYIECQHLLKLEDGPEIMKARTEWRPKHAENLGSFV